jgi:hypothetical protein
MAILLAFGRGTAVMAIVLFAFALLKRLIILFGFLFALVKFVILVAFLILIVTIAVAILRDWSQTKHGVKDI